MKMKDFDSLEAESYIDAISLMTPKLNKISSRLRSI
jgi:hypothetical protein